MTWPANDWRSSSMFTLLPVPLTLGQAGSSRSHLFALRRRGLPSRAASCCWHGWLGPASSCCEASTFRGRLVGEYPCRLPSITLLAPVATEDTRRHALMPFEGDTEVRDVRIADTGGNLFDRQASVEQKGARYQIGRAHV